MLAAAGATTNIHVYDTPECATRPTHPSLRRRSATRASSLPSRRYSTRHLLVHEGTVNALAFSQDLLLLASAGMDKRVRIWETASGALQHELLHDDYVLTLAFAPALRDASAGSATTPPVLAAGGGDKCITVWDAAAGEMKTQLQREGTVYSIAFSPTGELLATGGADQRISLWSRSGKILCEMEQEASVKVLAFSLNGLELACATGKEVRLSIVGVDPSTGLAKLKPHMNKENARMVNLPLLRATKDGNLDEVDRLLAVGLVDINFANQHGDTALILACWYGHKYITSRLLEYGAMVDLHNCDGNSALNVAAYRCNMEAVGMLVRSRATIDVPDVMTGKTALIKAAYVGHTPCATMLLDARAEVNHEDTQGYTALAFATSFNHEYMIQVLLHADANPNCKDKFGITPLIHASARGRFDTVQTLLQAGARPLLIDAEGKTALDYAESAGFSDIVAELREAAALGDIVSPTAPALPSPRTGPGAYGSSFEPSTPGVVITPRVPSSAEVGKIMLTPRVPTSHGTGDATARRLAAEAASMSRSPGAKPPVSPSITKKQLTPVSREDLSYLAKKLVHLSVMLEQDTVADDTKYPAFHR